jgi:N-acetyl-anhydromuramyl-L-alanine amidase AmpD
MAFTHLPLPNFPHQRPDSGPQEVSESLKNQSDNGVVVRADTSSTRRGNSTLTREQPRLNTCQSALMTAVSNMASRNIEKNLFRLSSEGYLHEEQKKDLVVLHFTAGTSCQSAFRTWQADQLRIATAYGVDPDGTIVEFFPPEAWAHHLGIKGTHRHDRRSIGIEIANPGPLKKDPRNSHRLNWWPRNWGTPYCDISDEGRYVTRSYRGMNYFASMPEEQQHSVGLLVRHLCEQFSIPREASLAARNGDFDPVAFANYKGIASHSNFRKDKWDVGPAFNWDVLGF